MNIEVDPAGIVRRGFLFTVSFLLIFEYHTIAEFLNKETVLMTNKLDTPVCQGVTYFIQPGDTFYAIANRFRVPLQRLIQSNPHIPDPNYLYVGQRICIPVACSNQFYTIRPGETLNIIAQQFGVTLRQILAANPQITNANIIYVGQRICIPEATTLLRGCTVILNVAADTPPELQIISSGAVYIHPTREAGQFVITFVATSLPALEDMEGSNAYVGVINIEGTNHSVLLEETSSLDQVPTWAGSKIIQTNPFSSPNNTVFIAPYNKEEDIMNELVLQGVVGECN